MKFIDVIEPQRVKKLADKTIILVSSGNFVEEGLIIKNVSLNLYIQKRDKNLGPYSLITAVVETDKGIIEMTYDEGYKGENALEENAAFLTSHLGISGLILRCVLQLKNMMSNHVIT